MRIAKISQLLTISALSLVLWLFTGACLAAGTGHHTHKNFPDIGKPGSKSEISQKIKILMFDNYFQPSSLKLAGGETVHFVIKNLGRFVHEFNIATQEMHEAHTQEMASMIEHGVIEADKINWDAAKAMQKKMGHGMHDEPNSVLLAPGEIAELIWQFPRDTKLEFACNIPGHYDSGMVGKIKLTD